MAKRFCSSEVFACLGTRTRVPSQLMPAKPVDTLSCTPSSTEVITTSAKTPSMRSVRVRIERSLCAQSAIRPPLTTSHTRAARTPRLRRRRTVSRPTSATGPRTSASLIAQALYGRLPAVLGGRIEGEEEAEGEGQEGGPEEAQGSERQRHADRVRDRPREDDPHGVADGAPQERQKKRLGHEGLEDLAPGGADGHLDPHLAHPLLERGELDVDVDHAAADQRQHSGEKEDEIVDRPLAELPLQPLGR